jgi:hypothetical protein
VSVGRLTHGVSSQRLMALLQCLHFLLQPRNPFGHHLHPSVRIERGRCIHHRVGRSIRRGARIELGECGHLKDRQGISSGNGNWVIIKTYLSPRSNLPVPPMWAPSS